MMEERGSAADAASESQVWLPSNKIRSMTAQIPIVRQVSWIATIPQALVLCVAVIVGWLLAGFPAKAAVVGSAAYLAYSIGSRAILTRSHRQGIALTRQGRFPEAIEQFEASYDFFCRHSWLDRFRSIVMLSPAAASYREMALVNMAFCHAQAGEGEQAVALYERALREFPKSALASSALQLIRSVTSAPAGRG